MTMVYNYPTSYFSGSNPGSKTVSRISVDGAPTDDYNNYKITSWTISYYGQSYTSAGVNAYFNINGVSIYCGMPEAQSSRTFVESGGSISNDMLDANSGSSMTITVYRNASGSGNACLFKGNITITLEYEYAYTACGAPTAVSQDTVYPAAGGKTNIRWSGASAGTLNPITGYEIYRSTGSTYTLLETVSSTSTSGSLSVSAPSNMGDWYYYKVKTLGTISGYDSGLSSAFANICAKTITACSAPTVSIAIASLDSGSSTTLSWSGAKAGTNNAITAYEIYKSTDNKTYSLAQTYQTTATSGSIAVSFNVSNDTTVYFKLKTKGTVSGYDSDYSNTVSVQVITYTNCGNIGITVSPTLAEGTTTLKWSASTNGRNNPLTGYKLQYQDSADASTWGNLQTITTVDTSTYTYTANVNTTRGAYRRFIITPIGTKAGYDGNSITSVSVRTNRLPATPTILAPSGNYATANAEPRIRFSISAEPDGQEQTIEYSVDDGEFKELLKVPAIGGIFVGSIEEVSQGAHTIKLRAFDGLARSEETTNVEFSHNPFTALANPSTPQAGRMAYISPVINQLRRYYGLESVDFESVNTGDIVKAKHFADFANALIEIQKISGTNHPLTVVKKGDLITLKEYQQIRNAIIGG